MGLILRMSARRSAPSMQTLAECLEVGAFVACIGGFGALDVFGGVGDLRAMCSRVVVVLRDVCAAVGVVHAFVSCSALMQCAVVVMWVARGVCSLDGVVFAAACAVGVRGRCRACATRARSSSRLAGRGARALRC